MHRVSHLLHAILNNKLNTIFGAMIAGYFFWVLASSYIPVTCTVKCPIYFYNTQAQTTFTNTFASITLQGPRKQMHDFLCQSPSIHIDAQQIAQKKFYIVQSTDLFLPDTIKLVHCSAIECTPHIAQENV